MTKMTQERFNQLRGCKMSDFMRLSKDEQSDFYELLAPVRTAEQLQEHRRFDEAVKKSNEESVKVFIVAGVVLLAFTAFVLIMVMK